MGDTHERHKGDDLLSDDPRLKFKWSWSKFANTGATKEDIAHWTHFQVSESIIGDWKMKVIQRGVDVIYYESMIGYAGENGEFGFNLDYEELNMSGEDLGFKTRIEAQIRAEKMLVAWITDAENSIIDWIKREYKLIMINMRGNKDDI